MGELNTARKDVGTFEEEHPKEVNQGERKAENMLGQQIGKQPADEVVKGGAKVLKDTTEGGNQKRGGNL